MGLAEPRKRIKISHDPRNTTWTNSTDSYGHRLMQQQGWKAGEALGAKGRGSKYGDAEAAKVNVKYKDDTLGLGASLKSKDIASQRTGFDAFQGLLGRLNAKTEAEVQVAEKKLEDKKLAMFAQGRWGGMLFVPGGLLVQSDPYKQAEALRKAEAERTKGTEQESPAMAVSNDTNEVIDTTKAEQAETKAEKKQRKEERRLRKEVKRLRKEANSQSQQQASDSEVGLPTPDPSSANEAEASRPPDNDKANKKDRTKEKSKKRERSSDVVGSVTTNIKPIVVAQPPPHHSKNGRHLLRGKNIQAKRMAFSDMKGLDEIFMRAG